MPATVRAQDNFWLGATNGGDGTTWNDPLNWSLGVPVVGQRAVLADHPDSGQAQTLVLPEDVEISRLYFTSTSHAYVIQAAYIEAEERDARLSVLESYNQVEIASGAKADLTLNLYVHGSTGTAHSRWYNYSSEALLIIGPEGRWHPAGDAYHFGTGTIVLQGRIIGLYSTISSGATLRVDNHTELSSISYRLAPSNPGTIYLASDLLIGNNWWRGSGGLTFAAYGADSPDRVVRHVDGFGMRLGNPGTITLAANPVDGSGNVIIRVSYFDDGDVTFVTIPGSTVQLSFDSIRYNASGTTSALSGGGNLHVYNAAASNVQAWRRPLTHTGRTVIERGIFRMFHSNASLSHVSVVELGAEGTLDLNGYDQTVGGLTGCTGLDGDKPETFGSVLLGGAALTINAQQDSSFAGTISGTGALVKAGEGTFTLASGYANLAGRTLRIAEGLLAVTGSLAVENGDLELAGGRVTSGSLAAAGQEFQVTLTGACEEAVLILVAGTADLTGATLTLALADGYTPLIDTQYTLLQASAIDGASTAGLFGWDNGHEWKVDGVDFRLEYIDQNDSIRLTVIPEPGVLGLLALAAAGLAVLRRRYA